MCVYKNTMGYYSAIKKNETMPSAATWMDVAVRASLVAQKVKNPPAM